MRCLFFLVDSVEPQQQFRPSLCLFGRWAFHSLCQGCEFDDNYSILSPKTNHDKTNPPVWKWLSYDFLCKKLVDVPMWVFRSKWSSTRESLFMKEPQLPNRRVRGVTSMLGWKVLQNPHVSWGFFACLKHIPTTPKLRWNCMTGP